MSKTETKSTVLLKHHLKQLRLGKYEISEQMIDKANALGSLGITKDTRGRDYPATSVTWYEAAKFVNWLNMSTGGMPAYKFDANGNFQLWESTDPGYDPNNLYRNKLAKYFLPSVNEWHKAAYYDPVAGAYYTYPTGSNDVADGIDFPGDPNFDAVFYDGALNVTPNAVYDVGILSPYGTAGQGGNASEWVETTFDWSNDSSTKDRTILGGSWVDGITLLAASKTNGITPSNQEFYRGFRVARIVPEPSTILLAIAAFSVLSIRRDKALFQRGNFFARNYPPPQHHTLGKSTFPQSTSSIAFCSCAKNPSWLSF